MLTKNRKLILDIINSSVGHMTAEDIFMKAKQVQPSIAIGTVYRNLGLMAEDGEIRRIVMPYASDRFDKTLLPHEHLICQKCGEFSDISVSDLKGYIEKQSGISIIGYDLYIKYICEKCKNSDDNT